MQDPGSLQHDGHHGRGQFHIFFYKRRNGPFFRTHWRVSEMGWGFNTLPPPNWHWLHSFVLPPVWNTVAFVAVFLCLQQYGFSLWKLLFRAEYHLLCLTHALEAHTQHGNIELEMLNVVLFSVSMPLVKQEQDFLERKMLSVKLPFWDSEILRFAKVNMSCK